jgi:hypothetical protein
MGSALLVSVVPGLWVSGTRTRTKVLTIRAGSSAGH